MAPKERNAEEQQQPVILICEGDATERQRMFDLLADQYEIALASKISEALLLVKRGAFHVILLSFDKKISSDELNVIQAISILQKIDPDLKVIIMAAEEKNGDADSLALEREIRSKGIFYYIMKPVDENEIIKVLKEAIRCSKQAKSTH
jgi:DNA-binding NtrC family response regulator